MPEIGQIISHYKIVEKIGQGGMGVVYLADDTTLDRKVALKFLPDAFTSDPERMARFEREAKLLASLNHPNIAGIYGLEQADGNRFLVLEYVEGETIQVRLSKGALPREDALELCRQIAEGLEAAHEKGVIHRDLKPANVMITAEEKVKILDFGLAKAYAGDPDNMHLSNSPTLSDMSTQQGVILGTAAYMPPEQAKGKTVDRQADIWAFGVVLFEMLSGRQLFTGETVSETLAAVIKSEPEWRSLPPNLHPRIRLMLERCLEKDPRSRYHNIADARVDIEKTLADPKGLHLEPADQVAGGITRRAILGWGGALLGAATVGGIVGWSFRPEVVKRVTRWDYELPAGVGFDSFDLTLVAVAPDGSQFCYTTGNAGIYLRSMDGFTARLVEGTEGAANPVFSPNGDEIAFFRDGELLKIGIFGSSPVRLTSVDREFGMSWDAKSNTILYGQPDGIYRVQDTGGTGRRVIEIGPEEWVHQPQLLPGGDWILFTRASGNEGSRWEAADIVVQRPGDDQPEILFSGGRDARYVQSGHLIYVSRGELWASAFDARSRRLGEERVSMVTGIYTSGGENTGAAHYAVSETGTLVYPWMTGWRQESKLAFVDFRGEIEELDVPEMAYSHPTMSPDGRSRLAVQVNGMDGSDVWIYDLAAGTPIRPLTEGGVSSNPIWRPGARDRVTFVRRENGVDAIYSKWVDDNSDPEPLSPEGVSGFPMSWSDTALAVGRAPASDAAIWMWSENGIELFYDRIETPGSDELGATFSPNRRWLAFHSDGPGERDAEIFVLPFPRSGIAPIRVTAPNNPGGVYPIWSRDGTELYFRRPIIDIWNIALQMIAVSIISENPFRVGPERELFTLTDFVADQRRGYDLTNDDRFLMLTPADARSDIIMRINVVDNWFEELKKRVPVP